jgi:hypothetical protein
MTATNFLARVDRLQSSQPLHGATLQIVRKPKRGDGAVSIIELTGRRLKIPVWMLLPECAEIKITERPRLSREALLSLT